MNSEMPLIAVCDHYAGDEKKFINSLRIQQEYENLLDITFDLEDGAKSKNAKEQRQLASYLLNEVPCSGRRGVRINAISTEHWKDDLKELLNSKCLWPDYITIPKISNYEELNSLYHYVNELCNKSNRSMPKLQIMIEDANGLRNINGIIKSCNIECISLGLLDFVSSLYGSVPYSFLSTEKEKECEIINYIKTEISIASHANNIVPSYSVCTELVDEEIIFQHALRAKNNFGYLRAWSIHPNQIKPIISAFIPSDKEIIEAVNVIVEAKKHNYGPIAFDGKMYDMASFKAMARKILRSRLYKSYGNLNLSQEIIENIVELNR